MSTALITGRRGFVGRHMEAELVRRGWTVEGVDVADDINGQDARDLFRHHDGDYDLVVHCAAHVGGRAGIDGRPLYLAAHNLQLDAALFEWALRTRPGRVVYYSSSAAYPAAYQARAGTGKDHHRLREDDIEPDHPLPAEASYGTVKLAGEGLAAMANDAGVRTHVFRPFSGYGPDQALDYPWPTFIARGAARADPFTIWGNGSQVRDWIHIDDVVAGTLACVEADVEGPVNLCTGRGVDFTELAGIVTAAAGYRPTLDYQLGAPSGVAYRVGDPTRLRQVYTPRVALEDAVAAALRAAAA